MQIDIASRSGPYSVVPAEGLASAIQAATANGKTWVVIDRQVMGLYSSIIAPTCSSERILEITANEESKSFERLTPIFLWLLESGFKRDCTILAIGGGVIQDIAAFVATVLVRGVRWEFIPTTLLSQCDSCIGAKSSINIGVFKNQLGSFHPPSVIHLVPSVLGTLPEEAIRSGLGEVIKFHLLAGMDAWKDIQKQLSNPTHPPLEPLIWKSLQIKKSYIEKDEFDVGMRNLLNYGHTFGHAFESATSFAVPHGIAVALGIGAATFISERRQMVTPGHFQDVHRLLRPIYQPFQINLLKAGMDSILTGMRADKKNTHGSTFVILTRGPGQMEKVKVDLVADIAPILLDYINTIQS